MARLIFHVPQPEKKTWNIIEPSENLRFFKKKTIQEKTDKIYHLQGLV